MTTFLSMAINISETHHLRYAKITAWRYIMPDMNCRYLEHAPQDFLAAAAALKSHEAVSLAGIGGGPAILVPFATAIARRGRMAGEFLPLRLYPRQGQAGGVNHLVAKPARFSRQQFLAPAEVCRIILPLAPGRII
jgi:hypothetical protein